MSADQPQPVEGGVFALKTFLLGKLRAHRPLTERMEYTRSIGAGDGGSSAKRFNKPSRTWRECAHTGRSAPSFC